MIRIILDRHTPPSGKAFNDNSAKRRPLSALTRHSPRRGKLFIPAFVRHSPRRGKQLSALARHSPRRGKPFIYYVNTYLVLCCFVLFCFVLLYILWISFSLLYKTTSKFFHVKFFIVPLKLLDTLHKHGYNVECKIV